MSGTKKMDRRSVKTCQFDEMKWGIVRFDDGQFSGILKGTEIEDEETGISLQDGNLIEGSLCMAKWLDGQMYQGEILFVTMDKEAAAKYLIQVKEPVSKPKKKNEAKPQQNRQQSDTVEPSQNKMDAEEEATRSPIKKTAVSKPMKRNEAKSQRCAVEPPPKKTKSEKAAAKEAEISAHKIMVSDMLKRFSYTSEKDSLDTDTDEEETNSMANEIINLKEQVIILTAKNRELTLTLAQSRKREEEVREELMAARAKLASTGNQGSLEFKKLRNLSTTGEVRELLSILTNMDTDAPNLPVLSPTPSIAPPQPSNTPVSRMPTGMTSRPINLFTPTASGQQQVERPSPCSQDRDIPDMVDLGGGALLKKVTRDMCVASAKSSYSKLTRNLLQAFFGEQTLASSCAEGKKSKTDAGSGRPPLPFHIVKAIKDFVCSKFPKVSEKDIVQVINCQCCDSRKKLKGKPTMTPPTPGPLPTAEPLTDAGL